MVLIVSSIRRVSESLSPTSARMAWKRGLLGEACVLGIEASSVRRESARAVLFA